MAASVVNLLSSASSANTDTYTSTSFTPLAGDLLVVFAGATATAPTVPRLTDSQNLGFTLSTTRVKNSSADLLSLWVANSFARNVSMTVTTSYGGDNASGQILAVAGVAGLSVSGLTAVIQVAGQSNQSSGVTPAPVFANAVSSLNAVIGFVDNADSPAALTPPSGWTESTDIGHSAPTHGGEWAFINSGSTLTTITWGSSSNTIFCDIVVELGTSAGNFAADDMQFPRVVSLRSW